MRPNLARIAVGLLCCVAATAALAADSGRTAPAVAPEPEALRPQQDVVVTIEPLDTSSLMCSLDDAIELTLPAGGTELANSTNRQSCGHGIRSCDASQVGQPCDPNNLFVICSAQSNGKYCCLAYAP